MKKVFLSKLCASQTPIDASEIFLPIIISFGYYIVVWIISSFATGYSIDGSSGAPGVFFIITLPYLFMLLHLSFLWVQQLFPVAVSLLTGLIIAATMLAKHRTKFQIVYDKGLKKQIIFVIISLAITGIQFIHKAIK
jgi:hypothetical protein